MTETEDLIIIHFDLDDEFERIKLEMWIREELEFQKGKPRKEIIEFYRKERERLRSNEFPI